jgi:hypothetical protein
LRIIPQRLLIDSVLGVVVSIDVLPDDVLSNFMWMILPIKIKIELQNKRLRPGSHWFTFVGDGDALFLDHRTA